MGTPSGAARTESTGNRGREGREGQGTGQGGGRSTCVGHRWGSRSSGSVSGGTCRCAVGGGGGAGRSAGGVVLAVVLGVLGTCLSSEQSERGRVSAGGGGGSLNPSGGPSTCIFIQFLLLLY